MSSAEELKLMELHGALTMEQIAVKNNLKSLTAITNQAHIPKKNRIGIEKLWGE
jgi:hypothetical protein